WAGPGAEDREDGSARRARLGAGGAGRAGPALPGGGGLRLPVSRRGVRAAAPGGEGVRRPHRRLQQLEPPRGGGRRRPSGRPRRPGRARPGARRPPRRPPPRCRARPPRRRARGPLPLGQGGAADGGCLCRGAARMSRTREPSLPYTIGLDARKIQDFGIGTYIRNLVRSLAEIDGENGYVLLVRPQAREPLPALPDSFRVAVESSPVYSMREL